MLLKALANCWGMIFLVAALGFSLADVAKKTARSLSLEAEVRHLYAKMKKRRSKLDDLEILIEFKLQVVRSELLNIKDGYRKKKFDELIASLPFELGAHGDTESTPKKGVEKVTLEELESEIYTYIKTKYKLKKTIQKLQSLVRQRKGNGAANESGKKLLRRVLFVCVLSLSGVVIVLIILNGFNIRRQFLAQFLRSLSLIQFSLIFTIYALFTGYLVVHGVLKSRFQNFKGLNASGHTDVQSMVYFCRQDY